MLKTIRFLMVGAIVLALFSTGQVFAHVESDGKWVLAETRVNPENHPLISYSESKGFEGSFDNFTLTETRFTRHWYSIQRAYKKYPDRTNDAITEFKLDRPPEELVPGQPFVLKVTGEQVVRKREQAGGILGRRSNTRAVKVFFYRVRTAGVKLEK